MPFVVERYESPRSARSSTSSVPSHPLTPVYELGVSEEMAIMSSSGSSNQDDDDEERIKRDATVRATNVPKLSPSLPSSSFSFGTCPSQALQSTPTYELGPFDYPLPPSGSITQPNSPTARRQSLALGMTHRRASIVARSPKERKMSLGPISSPPPSRRSSTCSQIATIPAAGARPAILHSASTTSGAAIPPPLYSPNNSRRASLMFPQKQLATPIPPSLLARRGSLPVTKLLGEDANHAGPSRSRASIAGQGAAGGWTTSTAQLYRRRESIMSEGADSEGSSRTMRSIGTESTGTVGEGSRRASVFTPPNLEALQKLHISSVPNRRSSLPHSGLGLDTHSPYPPGSEEKQRIVSAGSRLARSSLTSSEEGEESDETDTLPTPGTASTFDGFTNPWAVIDSSKVQAHVGEEADDEDDVETPKAEPPA